MQKGECRRAGSAVWRDLSELNTDSVAISASGRAFSTHLGARVAELRKARDITQVEMAQTLGVSQ